MSPSSPLYYESEIEWTGRRDLRLRSGNLPAIGGGAPPEFNGRAANWSPEHLLVAALNSCYLLTLIAIAEFSKVAVVSLSSAATGKLEKIPGGSYQISEIVVRPRVLLESAADLSRMPRILEKAKENCFISNSLKSAITVRPEVFHRQTPAAPCPLGEPESGPA